MPETVKRTAAHAEAPRGTDMCLLLTAQSGLDPFQDRAHLALEIEARGIQCPGVPGGAQRRESARRILKVTAPDALRFLSYLDVVRGRHAVVAQTPAPGDPIAGGVCSITLDRGPVRRPQMAAGQ